MLLPPQGRHTNTLTVPPFALGKWMTTDHTGFSRSLSNMPPLGFKEACHYILVRFLIMLAGAVLSGAIVFVMIAFGIPALISFLLSP